MAPPPFALRLSGHEVQFPRGVTGSDGTQISPADVALARQLKAIGDASHGDVARDIAAQLIKELCERHEIRLTHGHEID